MNEYNNVVNQYNSANNFIIDRKDYEVINLLSLEHKINKNSSYEVLKDFSKKYGDNSYSYFCDARENDLTSFEINININGELQNTQEFDVILFSNEASEITLALAAAKTDIGTWSNDVTQTLVKGWNKLRFCTAPKLKSFFGSFDTIRLIFSNKSNNCVWVGGIYQIKPQKAKLIFVEDHSYESFLNIAYPLLKENNVPVTWGLKIEKLGFALDNGDKIISEANVAQLANDPYSEISFHSWDGSADSAKTEYELREEISKCLYYLRKNGLLPKNFWRSACVQNHAPAMKNIDDMLNYCAMWDQKENYEVFPFLNKLNIKRISLHGKENSVIDRYFETLKKTHCVMVIYTHGINDNGGINATSNELNYFIEKIKEANMEDWLECTTLNKLITKYGESFAVC